MRGVVTSLDLSIHYHLFHWNVSAFFLQQIHFPKTDSLGFMGLYVLKMQH